MVIAFCFYQFLIERLCYSLAKISEILAGADILSMLIFVTFLHGGPVQISRYSAEVGRAASGNTILGDCMWRAQHLQGEHQRGQGEVSCCGLCRAKTVRRCFGACANILLTPRFCSWQYFVEAIFFVARQCFVES